MPRCRAVLSGIHMLAGGDRTAWLSGAGAVKNYIAHIGSTSLLSFKQLNA
jgi:hypothetical protein